MLVLGRKPGEEIYVDLPGGETIRIRYVRPKSGTIIAIGIEAPRSCRVRRGELLETDISAGEEEQPEEVVAPSFSPAVLTSSAIPPSAPETAPLCPSIPAARPIQLWKHRSDKAAKAAKAAATETTTDTADTTTPQQDTPNQ